MTVDVYPPRFRVEVVRDGEIKMPKQKVEDPETAAEVMRVHLGRVADEHMVVILLDAKNFMIGTMTVSVGTIDSCPASPKSILRAAILHNAHGVIVGHNHPSGVAAPSADDVQFFRKLKRSCDDMDVRLLDAIIIGDGTADIYSHRRSSFDF